VAYGGVYGDPTYHGKAPHAKQTRKVLYIYHETFNNNQLNDKNTVMPNVIFDAVLGHCVEGTPRTYVRNYSTHQSSTDHAQDRLIKYAITRSI
jgi:hypothetical protein